MLLKHAHRVWLLGFVAISLAGGCAADLGTPDYSDQAVPDPINPFPPVPPDPYQPGDDRLAVGYFYEGGRSETIPLNTVTTNFFIFVIDESRPLQTLTTGIDTSSDRAEGNESIEIRLNGSPFWGAGIIWDEPTDLSDWTTMYVSFKSSDPSFARFDLTLQYGEGEAASGVTIDPTAYGYANDGEWHFLQIPFQDAIDRGFDPSNVRSPFIIGAAGGEVGDVLLIDNLYFTKD